MGEVEGSRETPAPRPPELSELPGLIEMLDGVFRSGGGERHSMARDFPRFLTEANRANLRVIVESGRIVSHAGIAVRDASIEGVRLRLALMGAVATSPGHRTRGHAGACVRACLERAAECGADVMWISGGRSLYRRLGARAVGEDVEVDLRADRLAPFARAGVEVTALTEEDMLDAAELYSREPVRFVRPLDDWREALRSGFGMDSPCLFLGIRENEALVAYALARRPGDDGVSFVVEHAGSRSALLAALPRLVEATGASVLRLHLQRHDAALAGRTAAAGFAGRPVASMGTALVLRFAPLAEKLRARFLERAGEDAAAALGFAEEGPRFGPDNVFTMSCCGDAVTVNGRGRLAELIFGTPGPPAGGEPDVPAAPPGTLGDVLPLPALWYGLNFV